MALLVAAVWVGTAAILMLHHRWADISRRATMIAFAIAHHEKIMHIFAYLMSTILTQDGSDVGRLKSGTLFDIAHADSGVPGDAADDCPICLDSLHSVDTRIDVGGDDLVHVRIEPSRSFRCRVCRKSMHLKCLLGHLFHTPVHPRCPMCNSHSL